MGSKGAEFHPQLNRHAINFIVRKGYRKQVDSYSAFFENDKKTPTLLHKVLQPTNEFEVYICGLALDYCVKYSAIDCVDLGVKTFVILDATRALGDSKACVDELKAKGIQIIHSKSI